MPLVPLQRRNIAHATKDARKRLLTLSDEAKSHTEGEEASATARRYSDENERLEIWALEHDVESGSLDEKLRDAPVLRKRVLSLLRQLSGTTDTKSAWSRSDGDEESSGIAGLGTLVAGTPVHPLGKDDDGTCLSLDTDFTLPDSLSDSPLTHIHDVVPLGKDDDDGTCLSLDTDFTLPDSLSDSPLTHIHDVVNLLLGLGPTLLDPVPRDRLGWSAHKEAAHYDIDHVQAIFPHADKSLIESLGRSKWERRQYLIASRSKLGEGSREALGLDAIRPIDASLVKLNFESLASGSAVDSSDDNASEVGEASTAFPQTHGYDLDNNLSSQGPVTTTTSISPSDFQFSANDAQSTALTEPSKGAPHAELSSVRYAIPLPPHPNEQYSGEAFLCPFCAHIVPDIKLRADWK
jgi:hypothetical protein